MMETGADVHRRMPNFLILGAAKCGTSSLYYYLKQHPQVCLPKDKEPHFFDYLYDDGVSLYLSRHFKQCEGYLVRGEATPAYFHKHELVIPRMLEVFGNRHPKFIILFRDPVQRAWSHYLHMVRNALEEETFERALELENRRLRENSSEWKAYFSDGLYADQLEHWLTYFSRKCFAFILTEDLRKHTRTTLEHTLEFLGVHDEYTPELSSRQNVASLPRFRWLMTLLARPSFFKKLSKAVLSGYRRKRIKEHIRRTNLRSYHEYPEMKVETERMLRARYCDDVKRLEKLIHRDLSSWLTD